MSAQNEIVRFVAKVEMDPQNAAEYQKGLSDAEKANESLRESISSTVQQMNELRAKGEEASDAFKQLQKSLDSDTKALKESTKEAEKYSKALGLNQMSYNELAKHAKQVRKALNDTHKEANPQLWEKYNKELIATTKRMAELKRGTSEAKTLWVKLREGITPTFNILRLGQSIIKGLGNVAKKVFGDIQTETQAVGDIIQREMAVASAVWSHFIRNLSSSRGDITLTYSEVAKLAREAADLKDEIFELTNSYKVMEAEATPRMQELEATFRDTTKPIKERQDALEEMKTLELSLAQERLTIAEQEEEAAAKNFKRQTALEKDAAEEFIKNYIEAKKKGYVDEAETYGQLIEAERGYQQLLSSNTMISSKQYDKFHKMLEEVRAAIAETKPEVIDFYNTFKQYNLGNDEVTSAFADAYANRIKAQAEASESAMDAKYVRLNAQLKNQTKTDAEKAYNKRIKAAEDAYKKETAQLKEQLINRQITQAQFTAKSMAAEEAMLNAKIAINKAYGKEVGELEEKIADNRLQIRLKMAEAFKKGDESLKKWEQKQEQELQKEVREFVESFTDTVKKEFEDLDVDSPLTGLLDKWSDGEWQSRSGKLFKANLDFDTEMTSLEQLHDAMMLTEEEYLARKKHLHEEYAKTVAEINLSTWMNAAEVAGQFLEQASNAVSALREAEEADLEARMQAELTAAGDNADERERIEAEYEARKLETQKKYADADMAINIAKTIAAGALAAMQAFAQLGPVAGAVAAALLAVTTAAEVAAIVAQRNAIKNTSASSSSSTATTGGAVGFSEGGYTGDGGRLQVAGVVHRGEYVVAAPELRDPYVARQVAGIERMRLARTGGTSRYPGFAEGGYTDVSEAAAGSQSQDMSRQLSDIISVLLDIHDTPIPAIMTTSQYEAELIREERHRKFSSLRRKNK